MHDRALQKESGGRSPVVASIPVLANIARRRLPYFYSVALLVFALDLEVLLVERAALGLGRAVGVDLGEDLVRLALGLLGPIDDFS